MGVFQRVERRGSRGLGTDRAECRTARGEAGRPVSQCRSNPCAPNRRPGWGRILDRASVIMLPVLSGYSYRDLNKGAFFA